MGRTVEGKKIYYYEGAHQEFPQNMRKVIYFGMGPEESYVDKHHASGHGMFITDVKNLHEDYVHPQENGSHFDCSYVTVTGTQAGLAAAGLTPFSLHTGRTDAKST